MIIRDLNQALTIQDLEDYLFEEVRRQPDLLKIADTTGQLDIPDDLLNNLVMTKSIKPKETINRSKLLKLFVSLTSWRRANGHGHKIKVATA